ncbi:alpha/beta hydrolase [Marivirga sp. S37H4]|uniref:Alpha/beta hydrolase n=1 Tax=Marivirga aurantiaca TaxID=2802615 RepID=A0A934WZA6_9BACT|nr:alpha/beta hydrolase-fold protein [Marivirga aurantiaca]MBK6265656.1 alpha/beta hydrolase [Marivirga aurantiaca]
MKKFIPLISLCFLFSFDVLAQVDSSIFNFRKHIINSEALDESREYWVSLPMNYSDTAQYPVIYVFDAEWRFDLVRNIEYDLAGNRKIPAHIIVGIPHVEMEVKRAIDLTFGHSRMEYDGDPVDSTWFNASNSGGAHKFYQYLKEELITDVDKNYSTNTDRILVGHSYGGYFAAYLLTMDHPFTALQIYDPSIWYGNGEVTNNLKKKSTPNKKVNIYISYQIDPVFHGDKIKEFISEIETHNNFKLNHIERKNETHNSLFMISFLEGIQWLYK